MKVIQIVAIEENRGIGKDNKLLFHLPNDLKHFKSITENSYIITGRKNYESIGRNLPNRVNIIVTKTKGYARVAKNCIVCSSIEEAIQTCEYYMINKVFIIGGGEIYKQTLKYTDEIYLTEVKAKFDADVFYPELGNEFIEVSRIENKIDLKNKYAHDFVKLVRRWNYTKEIV
jgi:dihydrofolate reductase